MKILILANNDIGLYKFRKELLERLIADGHEVCVSVPGGEFVGALEKLGCKVESTEISRHGTNPIEDLKLMVRYRSYVKRFHPDIVFTYTIKPNIYGGIVCAFMGVSYISNITGLGTAIENPGAIRRLLLAMYKIALKKANCVFFQNAENRDFFVTRKLVNGKYRLIPGSGVNVADYKYEEYPKRQSGHDKFLFIGRIMKDKGIRELFEAACRIKEEYPDASFDIVGGEDEDFLEDIHRLEGKGIIRYWGQQSDVRPFIKDCSAVVLPSYHEGMSNVLLEAASVGRPVLASDIPGCRESFDEDISGFGFRPGDADSLYHVLKKFILLPTCQKAEMGRNGRRKMETKFSRDIVIQAYLEEIGSAYYKMVPAWEGR